MYIKEMPMFLLLFYIAGIERCMECGENYVPPAWKGGKTIWKCMEISLVI
jgi:hypothetical protein